MRVKENVLKLMLVLVICLGLASFFISRGTEAPEAAVVISNGKTIDVANIGLVLHEVYEGENLWCIGRMYDVEVKKIKELNNLSSSTIYPKQKLKIIPKVNQGKLKPISKSKSIVASWYGEYFNGRKTANGETYIMCDLTAAHKTLPFGTILLVENPRTGKRVIVKINDRGPFVKGRILDLSYGAARLLGMVKKGVEEIRITEVILVN